MIQLPLEISQEHLRTSYRKGDVLLWKNFPGREQPRDSYFVLLTNCNNDQFIVARATKRTHLYSGPQAKRIAHDIVLLRAGEVSFFPMDTVIDLTWINRFTVEQLSHLLGLAIQKAGTLPPDIIRRINERVRDALTISPRDQELILRSS